MNGHTASFQYQIINISSQVLMNTLERARTMPTDDKLKIQHVQLEFSENSGYISFSEAMVNRK